MTNKITKAAIRLSDKIYVGFDHGECFKQLPSGVNANEIEQGFIDINGDFLDRKQAMLIAKEAGQISYDTSKQTLISEDLHLYWLKELEENLVNKLEELHAAYCGIESVKDKNGNLKEEVKQLKQQVEEKDNNCLILYSLLYSTLENQGCEDVASAIEQMTGLLLDKQSEQFKDSRNCYQLLKSLAQKEDNWKKLKRWCADHGFSEGWNSVDWDEAISAVLDKMHELENKEKI